MEWKILMVICRNVCVCISVLDFLNCWPLHEYGWSQECVSADCVDYQEFTDCEIQANTSAPMDERAHFKCLRWSILTQEKIPDCAGSIGWMSAFHIDKTHTKVQNSTKRTTIVNKLKQHCKIYLKNSKQILYMNYKKYLTFIKCKWG